MNRFFTACRLTVHKIWKLFFHAPIWWKVVFVITFVTTLIAGTKLIMRGFEALTTEVPAYGGSITEGIVGTPRFLNPVLEMTDADKDLNSLIYAGLMKKDTDGNLVPDMATEYTVSGDNLVYTFTINENATFHDGEIVTADDVLFTTNMIKDPLVKSPKRTLWDNVRTDVVDTHTVRFTLKTPFSGFLETTTVGILPKHIWNDTKPEQFAFSPRNTNPIGSGPFKIKKYSEKNTEHTYVLEVFKKYINGRAFLDMITIIFFTDKNDMTDAIKSGRIDHASAIDAEKFQDITTGALIKQSPMTRIFALYFNPNKSSVFLDSAVKKAIDLAIDKNAIIKNTLFGFGTVIDSPLPVSGTDIYDPVQARLLLSDAGWKPRIDGMLEKTITTGKKSEKIALEFTLTIADTTEFKSTAEEIKKNLEAVGIKMSIQSIDASTINQDIIRPRSFDAVLFGQSIAKPSDMYAFWHSSGRSDPGINIAQYANKTVDSALEKILKTEDMDEQNTLIKTVTSEIKKDQPAVFLFSPFFLYATDEKTKGIVLPVIAQTKDRFTGITKWYQETEHIYSNPNQ